MTPSFMIIDKKARLLKQDENGMQCVFDDKDNAESYLSTVSKNDRNECEIVTRYCEYSKADVSLKGLIKEADTYLNTNELTSIGHGSILHQKFKAI